MWAATPVQVFYLQESKCSKQIKYMWEKNQFVFMISRRFAVIIIFTAFNI